MGGVSGGGVDAGLCDRVGLLLTLLARGHYRHMVSKDIQRNGQRNKRNKK